MIFKELSDAGVEEWVISSYSGYIYGYASTGNFKGVMASVLKNPNKRFLENATSSVDGMNALMLSARHNNITILSYLVYCGWDTNFTSSDNKTALSYAIEFSSTEAQAYLREHTTA